MAKFNAYDYRHRVFLPVSLEDQLMPGTLEFAIHTLVETIDAPIPQKHSKLENPANPKRSTFLN